MRWSALVFTFALAGVRLAHADRSPIRCDDQATADLEVDGMLDDWPPHVVQRIGKADDAQLELRCSWDGTALALSLDLKDDRIVRIGKGPGEQDHVSITVRAGGKPMVVDVYPGNAMAKAKITRPPRVAVGESLQPKGFSVEVRVPASAIPSLTASTPSLDLTIVFTDADKATGGDTFPLTLDAAVELSDRNDLLEDFLREVRLKKTDLKLDKLANLDPDRRGNERIVAGGTVIGVLTDRFAYVTLPAARPTDVKKVELVPLGARGLDVVAATVRQTGNGGARELLMLWTVWSGQLQPLGQIELKKEVGANVLASTWKTAKGKKGVELWVEPQPAVGWTEQSWNEAPAEDADAIVPPWDRAKAGVIYSLQGAELGRRDIAPKQQRR